MATSVRSIATVGALALALTSTLAACGSGVTAAEPADSDTSDLSTSPVLFIEGEWVCDYSYNDYEVQFRISADQIEMTTAQPGDEQAYLSRYGYTLEGSILTTYPEDGGAGYVIELPETLSFEEPNLVRITEPGGDNLVVTTTEDSASWTDSSDETWECTRGPVDFSNVYTSNY